MSSISGPATIDQLVQDAASHSHTITARLIRDWTEKGLLDYPQRRPAGKGHGSHPALYDEKQRHLLLTLLHHRKQGVGIRTLSQIPVGIWIYWGHDFVPLRQVRVAMATWIGDPRASLRRARQIAQTILQQIDHPAATPAARKALLDMLADAAYTGRVDLTALESAARAVFEPGFSPLHRAVGHLSAPLTVDSQIGIIDARLRAIAKLTTGQFSDDDFRNARHAHLLGYAQYVRDQPFLATQEPADHPGLYEPVTAESTLNQSCDHLLTALGLGIIYPERTAEFTRLPAPHITFRA
ncbi:hypothetical protein [Streptomyces sp. NBC_00078]|uniref:hypothetical protein n=1 Tax=unclassified Streptomyces TaxID=2593676 RepID=UPI00224C7C81|nr:hypothetical protein [Streptomyces sp. NBC_00078]MCX5426168.1 hypothetical protein [Streptomyces sp. NBC_00078]